LNAADAPSIDYRDVVRDGYDACALRYAEERQKEPNREIEHITRAVSAGGTILEVGCGPGIPNAKYLSENYEVTGVDLSASMIRLAEANAPRADFIEGDITQVSFPDDSFDGIVAFYSLFHVPRSDHSELFRRFARWLRPGGAILVTVAEKDDGPGYTEDDFFDVTMYWSNFSPAHYRDLLEALGFQIEAEGIIGHGYEEVEAPDERHPFLFARLPD